MLHKTLDIVQYSKERFQIHFFPNGCESAAGLLCPEKDLAPDQCKNYSLITRTPKRIDCHEEDEKHQPQQYR